MNILLLVCALWSSMFWALSDGASNDLLGFESRLTELDCPHCWGPGTIGSKPFDCREHKGQCPCKDGHTNFRCSGCKPNYHGNAWVCCKNTEYHVEWNECKECGCDPSGTLKCVDEICICKDGYNGEKCDENECGCNPAGTIKCEEGICICKDGYNGITCHEHESGEKVEFGDIGPYEFRRVIIKCYGRCLVSYLTFTFGGDLNVLGSDKKIVKKKDEYVTKGTMFCKLDKNSDPKTCPAFILDSDTIHLRLHSAYGSTNATLFHEFDNLKSIKVRYREPSDIIEA